MDAMILHNAAIVAGEASGCVPIAMIAVMHVLSRNSTFYGNASPTPMSVWAATHWNELPDPTNGAYFLFSLQDIQLDSVSELVGHNKPTAVFMCSVGALYAFRAGPYRGPTRIYSESGMSIVH